MEPQRSDQEANPAMILHMCPPKCETARWDKGSVCTVPWYSNGGVAFGISNIGHRFDIFEKPCRTDSAVRLKFPGT